MTEKTGQPAFDIPTMFKALGGPKRIHARLLTVDPETTSTKITGWRKRKTVPPSALAAMLVAWPDLNLRDYLTVPDGMAVPASEQPDEDDAQPEKTTLDDMFGDDPASGPTPEAGLPDIF